MLSRKETRYFVKQILPNGKELFLKKTVSNKPTWTKEYKNAKYFSKKRPAKKFAKSIKRDVKGTLKIRKLSIKVCKNIFNFPKSTKINKRKGDDCEYSTGI